MNLWYRDNLWGFVAHMTRHVNTIALSLSSTQSQNFRNCIILDDVFNILHVPIVLYFLLVNFIIFLALHVKVALPENEYLYFLSSLCVLPRVTGCTSLILWIILSFLQPSTLCALPKLYIYTSLYMIYYFSSTWHESCTSRNLFCTFRYYCISFPLA
jgi:hypothetical protein